MKTIRLCSGCGTPLPADSPAELCPQCLLRSGIHTEVESIGGNATRIPVPGETFGPYRILRLLGHGGMGRVFEAEHTETGRRVALKVMGQALASEQDRKRFLREGRLAAAVNHPNVVYIHGSEEIDGVPIIAMELVHGGTLKDRIKRGPLPIAEAVEAALQVADGLEAANAAGVLHRDIKPANCFISSDGSVKVGDFGLSVSTLARGESLLTATGAVMGTPAYASPEQLRGEELDVRSDIYSIGATLYHLLTGKTPFGATDFVKLITEVLDKEPANPRALRSEIPAELARLVLRCLAKDRKARFQTYAELRDALLPFQAGDVTPAKPAMRLLATVVDDLIAYMPIMVFLAYWSYDPLDMFAQNRTPLAFAMWVLFFGAYVSYYAVCEGIWGAGIGKMLCGLRVVNERRETPGIARALGRILIYAAPFTLPPLVRMLFVSASELQLIRQRGDWEATDWSWIPLTIALFVTMRSRNGYAAIQDLVTRTRVIVRPKTQPRPALARTETSVAPMVAHADAPRTFGPYEVTGTLWKTADAELALAFDSALRRKVWILLTTNGAVANEARRELSRVTRLRWLDGGVANGSSWNAYEALDGEPFLAITQRPQSWNAVRFWLLDLGEECSAAAERPESAPVLALDRLWITSSGHAVVLDFGAPGLLSAPASQPINCADQKEVQAFLASVAQLALNGSASAEAQNTTIIPLHARQFLASLAQRSFDEARFIVGNLRSLIAKPAEVTRTRRGASVMFVPAVTIILAVFFAAILTFERTRWDRVWKAFYPGEPSLRVAGEILVDNVNDAKGEDFDLKDYAIISTYIAKHFGHVLTNEAFWSAQPALTMVPDLRERVRECVTNFPATNNQIAEEAERTMPPRIAKAERAERLAFIRIAGYVGIGVVILAALIDLFSALAFRVVPVLRMFGVAVVNRAGARASRGRLFWRAVVLWLPTTFAVGAVMKLVAELTRDGNNVSPREIVLLLSLAGLLIAAMIYAVRRPSAGLQDRLAGTRLVPM